MSPTRGIPGHPARILIVDDELNNRTLLEIMLSPEGFVVMTAASGEEALAMVAQLPPDLILLDVLMPGLGGYEVAGKLKSNAATKHIPIIMVTALDDRDARLVGLTAGAEDFLTRPLDRAELCVRVRNLLRLKTASDGALAERDNSMGMVSHDLRNLLNGIVLQASLLTRPSPESNDSPVDVANRILGFAARMDRLVEDLVDVVSIDAGKIALEPQPHDVVALLGEAIESHAQAASTKNISIRSDTVERTLVTRFDRGRMLQVLDNLMSNARKFTPRGGVIAVRGERLENQLQISVSDTGSGIPSDMLEAVFERFRQVGKPGHQGLGLGLYISRCIVESHGGRIWVESRLGHGSTFYFTIPEDPSARTPVPGLLPIRKASVLVVDDDPTLAETLVVCLKRRGFDARCQSSPREALLLVESSELDVVITDLNMEEMTGLALCKRIAVIRPGLPVIVTTGFGGADARVAALDAGAYDFLAKPIDIDLLRLTIDRAVLSRSGPPPEIPRSVPVALPDVT